MDTLVVKWHRDVLESPSTHSRTPLLDGGEPGGARYDRRTGTGRVLLYNVGGVTEHGKFDVVVTARSHAEIRRYIAERIRALITRYLRRRPAGS